MKNHENCRTGIMWSQNISGFCPKKNRSEKQSSHGKTTQQICPATKVGQLRWNLQSKHGYCHIKVKQHLASSNPRKERRAIYHYFHRILLVYLLGDCYNIASDRDKFILEAHLPNEFLQLSCLDHVDNIPEICGDDKIPDHQHLFHSSKV